MSKDKKYTYKVIEENKDDVMQTKVVKKNVDVEFTMQELYNQEEQWDRAIRELEANLKLQESTMKNVEDNHADAVSLVSQLDPLKQHAILLWLKALSLKLEIEPRLKMFKEAFDEHNAEVKEIIKQTGWKAPAVHLTMGKNDNDQKEETGESDAK